ncbi:hypothetical protein [Lentzea cavernae]|uniref:Integral membrane protein n=1 Tax=Lentzea cavernae TaxID=2020703 RepID=A0ABQ3M6F3_9PSEU|nr:hypothetical protein [Lentzea cavernae]GHH33661.1 hypothetical protein GCM10017774_16460 [Lentzea cavernae]
MDEVPEALARLASERGLGACTRQLRRRVTVLTVLGVLAVGAVVVLLLVLSAAPLVILTLPVLVAGLLLHRRRDAGLYVFDGGVVVASGWTAPQVVPWNEVEGRLAESVRRARG